MKFVFHPWTLKKFVFTHEFYPTLQSSETKNEFYAKFKDESKSLAYSK